MASVYQQTASCPSTIDHELGKVLVPPAIVTEDEESVPSTEFGSDVSDSECGGDEAANSDDNSPFSVEDTLLIFDWDNTILPTTWLEEQGLCLDDNSIATEEQREQLRTMAEYARRTLQLAKTYGKVILVTNAEHGWVELSCKKFMPELYRSLQEGIKILSARSTYEQLGVAQPSEWKYLAFAREIDGFYEMFSGDRQKNIISIGDSPHERWALIRVAERLPNSCAKALKFMEKPELGQLLREHELISGCLEDIVRYDGSLDLCIQRP